MDAQKPIYTQGRFFLTMEELNGYSSNIILDLKKDYDVTFGELDRSSLTGLYWTHYGETIVHGNVAFPGKELVQTNHSQFAICRPKGSETPLTAIAESILQSPLTKVNIYSLDDTKSKVAKYLAKHQQMLASELVKERTAAESIIISTHSVTYAFPELSLIEKDYIRHLFQYLKRQIYEDQEDAAATIKLSWKRMPVNQIINRFVIGLELEELAENYYLTFIYEEHGKSKKGASTISSSNPQSSVASVPMELEIMADIPLDEDDEILSGDENGVTIDDEPYIRFALVLQIHTSA